ncbi:MAG: hypothetical protein FJW96_12750, partial [Actinobacteria bacterium]|nr:hypothetical protein [Actinomycetota bacterium]
YLSIPRDLQVEIPGVGVSKINAAFQTGGPALALRTVKLLTGLPVNHVLFVDFDRFREVIDTVGGIEIDVPDPIRSNAFDCPYKARRCASWRGWRFAKGRQHMDGRRALVYARIRENRLDSGETDFTRSRRQQDVIEATIAKLSSVRTAARFPWIGSDVVEPLATDLDTNQVLSLGWAAYRAKDERALHCRLGGEGATVGGESVILGSEDNVAVISMFKGESTPMRRRAASRTRRAVRSEKAENGGPRGPGGVPPSRLLSLDPPIWRGRCIQAQSDEEPEPFLPSPAPELDPVLDPDPELSPELDVPPPSPEEDEPPLSSPDPPSPSFPPAPFREPLP